MAWIAPQISDCQSRISAVEIQSLVNASGNVNIVAEVTQTTVDLIRGYVASVTVLGPEGTLPDKLIDCFKDIWAYKFVSSVPGRASGAMYDTRRDTYKDALKLLESVRKGDFRIEVPAQPATEQPIIPRVTVSHKRQRRAQRYEAGLGANGPGGPYY